MGSSSESFPEDLVVAEAPGIRKRLGVLVLAESSLTRKIWEFLLLIMLLYIGLIFPYRLAFVSFRLRESMDTQCEVPEETQPQIAWDTIVDVFFWIDLLMNFFLTYRNSEGLEEFDLLLIAKKYISCYFWLNFLACLPPSVFTPFVELLPVDPGGCSNQGIQGIQPDTGANQASRLVRLQRVTRLARLARLIRIVKIVSYIKKSAAALNMLRGFRMLNWMGGLLWVLHIMACGWYLCAAVHTDHANTWVGRRILSADGDSLLTESAPAQWVHSMYFVMTVFTTVGFGDMSAVTVGEICYVCLVMLVGVIVHSIVIGEVINLLHEVDRDTEWKRKQQDLLEAYGDHAMLHEETVGKLTDFVAGLRTNGGTYDRDSMRKFITGVAIPRQMLGEIPDQLFQGLLVRNRFVQICAESCSGGVTSPRFAMILSTMLSSQNFAAEDIVYQVHDHAFNVYFVMNGTFAFVDEVKKGEASPDAPPLLHESEGMEQLPITNHLCVQTGPSAASGLSASPKSSSSKFMHDSKSVTISPPECDRRYSSHEKRIVSSRVGQESNAWTARKEDRKPWLRLDLGSASVVCGVVVQGHPLREEWVTGFKVSLALHAEGPWESVGEEFAGCTDNVELAEAMFGHRTARFVRLEPTSYQGKVSLRAGVQVIKARLHPYKMFGKLNFFGDELLNGDTRKATARCESRGQVLMLHKRDLLSNGSGYRLLNEFPQFERALRFECTKREIHRRRMLLKLSRKHDYRNFAASMIQAYFRMQCEKSQALEGSQAQRKLHAENAFAKGATVLRSQARSQETGTMSADPELMEMIKGLSADLSEVKSTLALLVARESQAPAPPSTNDHRLQHARS